MIDTHTHLDDSRYGTETVDIINSLAEDNIDFVINNSYDYDSMIASHRLATTHDRVYCTLGMHPHDAKYYDDRFVNTLIQLSSHHKVVGIGEIGLDYYYDNSDRKVQRDVFAQQIELADQLQLPISLHIRDAYSDAQDILTAQKKYLNHGVLWHCYSGSGEYAKQWVRQGHYFALGGAITFKNANKQDVIDNIPIQHILTETDCPYMTPHPYRGKINYPKYITYILERLANMYGVSHADMELQILHNCKSIYRRIL